MGSQRFIGTFLVILMMGFLFGSSQAYQFYVGGKDGWVLKPSEDYNHWAERLRFQVNDTLFFKYKKGCDSVLVVSKDDYYSCNTKNPTQSLKDGDSIFKFDHSGPFFFISGKADHCKKGQRLIVVVLAVRHKTHVPPPAPQFPSPWSAPSPKTPCPPPKASPPVSTPPSSPPPTASPPVSTPPTTSTGGDSPSGSSSPAPVPTQHKSSSQGLTGSVLLGLSASIGVSLVLGSFVGMV